VVEHAAEAHELIQEILPDYSSGLIAEQYIKGREIAVPWLEAWPGGLLEIVEWTFKYQDGYQIMTYESEKAGSLEAVCPPELSAEKRQAILALSNRAVRALEMNDLGRVDIRLADDGTPYLIETNALPGLAPNFSCMTAARCKGLEFAEVIDLVIKSAARRYQIPIAPQILSDSPTRPERSSARDHGIQVGRFPAGEYKAITAALSSLCYLHILNSDTISPWSFR
jgi:D-alanine-D-alanine ligase-like ATP-grasp enzyme